MRRKRRAYSTCDVSAFSYPLGVDNMRREFVLLMAFLIAAPVGAQQAHSVSTLQDPPSTSTKSFRLILAPHVVEELDALADTLGVETVRCLIGVVEDGEALIDLAWRPSIQRATANQVQYQSCPSATLVLWHNHPRTASEAPEYGCYLSATDVREAQRPRAPPIQMVQVSAEVGCWWSRREIQAAGQVPVLFPRPHQRWGRPVSLDTAACREELRHLVACALLLSCPDDRGVGNACSGDERPAEVAVLGRRDEHRSECGVTDNEPMGKGTRIGC